MQSPFFIVNFTSVLYSILTPGTLTLLLLMGSARVSVAQPSTNSPATSSPLPLIQGGSLTQESPYTLGVGDRIQLDIFNVPEYSKEYQVLIDGTVNLPIVGSVAVEGFTLQQTATAITQRYAPWLTDPIITVNLVGIRPLKIGLAGAITHPGSYTMNPTTGAGGLQFPTLIQALELAKGVTARGDLRQVQIRRPQRVGPEQILTVNLWEFFQTGDLRQDITLRDGDSIFIPTVNEIDSLELRERANANFSADLKAAISIAVVGEVNRPGPYILSVGGQSVPDQGQRLASIPTVTQAIRAAGGITQEANIREIQVRRRRPDGSEQLLTANLWKLLQSGDIQEDVPLQEGDSIVIPKADDIDLTEISEIAMANFSPDRIRVYLVGEVAGRGAIEVPPNTSLHQALLAAGGFNQQRAKKDAVELIRQNPNGTVSRRQITIDFSQGLNPENNPTLRPNDVIVVARSGLVRFTDGMNTILTPFTRAISIIRVVDDLIDNLTEDEVQRTIDRNAEEIRRQLEERNNNR